MESGESGVCMLIYTSSILDDCLSGGFRARSKEQGLGPCREGVRGFKSHPPHQKLGCFWSYFGL